MIAILINLLICVSVNVLPMYCHSLPIGFSYTKFLGPVSGPEQQILIYDAHHSGHPHVDYIAQPDYQFSYGIDDPKSGVLQSRKEIRRGDLLYGEYSVSQPDGTVRMVKYSADDANGYQAEVTVDGQSVLHQNNQDIRVIPVQDDERVTGPTINADQNSDTKVINSSSHESSASEDEENSSTDSDDYQEEKNSKYRHYASDESLESDDSDEESY